MLRHAVLTLTLILLNGAAFAAAASYPPYPNVWEWQAPASEGTVTDLSAVLLSNGDVLIRAVYEKNRQKTERYYLMFDAAALDEAKTKAGRGAAVLRDGSTPTVLATSSTKIELSDGTTIEHASNRYRQCYRGPAQYYYIATDSSGRELAQRSFFYLLDKPARFQGGGGDRRFDEPNASCPTEGPLDLKTYVEPLSADFLPLRDDTSLMILPEHALVIRLTRDLTSRSRVLNDRVFVFDYHGDPMIVSELTRKDYGSPEDIIDQQQYQKALDDFREHLVAMKGKNVPARFQFKLVEGANLPVCAAYLERLNSTSFDVTPLCARPENGNVPGFEVLPRQNLTPEALYGISEQLFGFALHGEPEYYDQLRARELAYCRDPDSSMCKWVEESQSRAAARGTRWREPIDLASLRNGPSAWKYDPAIDIDNDGTADPVLVFKRDRCGGLNSKNVLELAPTYAFVMDSTYRTVDVARTRAIFGHPNPVWPTGPSPRFRFIGVSFGVFAYRDQVYYDTYFNSLGDFEDRRRDGGVLSTTLGVFHRAENVTRQVCELRLLDR